MFHLAFKKDTEKGCVIRLEVKGLIKIIEKFRAEKTLCMFLSPSRYPLRGMEYRLRKQLWSFESEV